MREKGIEEEKPDYTKIGKKKEKKHDEIYNYTIEPLKIIKIN